MHLSANRRRGARGLSGWGPEPTWRSQWDEGEAAVAGCSCSPVPSCWCTYFGSGFGVALSQAGCYHPSASRHSRPSGAVDLRVPGAAVPHRRAHGRGHEEGPLQQPAPTGQLVSRLTTDVQEFKSSFKLVISQGLRSCTQVAGCLVSLSMLSPRLTLLLMVATPTLMGVGTLMGSALRKLSRQCQEQVARATGVADEALGNVRTVRAFAMEHREEERYGAELEESRCKAEELGQGIALFQGLSNIAFNCMVLGTLFIGGSLVAGQQLTGGDLMSFLVASQTVQRSMANLSVLFGQVVRGLSAGGRVFEYMTLSPCIPLSGGCSVPREHLRGAITFHNVCFSYPSRPSFQVLRDFTLTLPPGKIVALVGQSGGGKTTVASLLERFYDPTAGVVTLDGRDLRTLDPSWLRGQVIGFISQEPVLFGTTIMENIRFGKLGATDEEVYAAAREANAHEFITSFPEGYNTIVGERGATLSGGQKQRLAIARALIKQPAVLILDEATSALDSESERVVQEALDRASAGRTVLVIAHRLSTVRGAHHIVVMAHGRVCEVGTHEELLKKGGLYAELIRRQALDAPAPEVPRGPRNRHPRS
ncbi:mitochondrial potassium channel ATP-binding subunit isoform X2 [Mirounga angustirostris]|uniref:mitochondrial potassium channel ATP-binding subunit isoform X2 n=1 Tax=Mirounga angustirostris TaxID=9716 RepID=UPI00313E4822